MISERISSRPIEGACRSWGSIRDRGHPFYLVLVPGYISCCDAAEDQGLTVTDDLLPESGSLVLESHALESFQQKEPPQNHQDWALQREDRRLDA